MYPTTYQSIEQMDQEQNRASVRCPTLELRLVLLSSNDRGNCAVELKWTGQ
jgi:hypothetical protein